MANPSTEHVLSLVQQALDEIDDRPIDVTARRAARIASLLGETELAVYLGLELKPHGGHPPANAEDTRRLMADPSLWGDPNGPAEAAVETYMAARRIEWGPNEGMISSHGLAEVEGSLARLSENTSIAAHEEGMHLVLHMRTIRERVRHKIFTALCSWERQLIYANVNERIFERFRNRVDAMLALGAPAVLDQFSAVYRRLREATKDPTSPVAEDLAQAVTTCRRILKAVADHLLPGVTGATTDSGNSLNDSAYRNRIFEFVKTSIVSEATGETVKAAVGGIYDRFSALDKLASKGVHAELGAQEAELCAIHTYLIAGELLALREQSSGGRSAEESTASGGQSI